MFVSKLWGIYKLSDEFLPLKQKPGSRKIYKDKNK